MANKIQIRRGLAALWVSVNPTLSNGEFGYETDTGKTKIGNGVDDWNTLGYEAGGSGVSQTYVDAADALKVDKVSGESLISITDITKLAGIEAGAQVNDPNTVVAPSGVLPVLDGSNLTGLPSGAEINDIAPSTSSLYSSSKTLTLLGSKVDKVTGMGLSTNDFTDSEKVVVDNTSGTNTGDQDLSGKVDKVTGQSLINTTDITKLAGIATGAQVNDPNTTTQGNTFNGVSQLVKTDGAGKLPAIDGSQLTGISGGSGATINDAVINTTNAYSSSKIDTTFVHNTDLIIATKSEETFLVTPTWLLQFNGATIAFDSTNKRETVTIPSGSKGIAIYPQLTLGHRYTVHVNVSPNTAGTLSLATYWGGLLGMTLSAGDNYYTFISTTNTGPIVITGSQAGIFYLNYTRIQEVPLNNEYATKGDVISQVQNYAPIILNTSALQYVKVTSATVGLGQNATPVASSSIALGYGSNVTNTETAGIAIGNLAIVNVNPTYGSSGGGQVAIGASSNAGSWRATAVGSYAWALAVSASTLGYGTYCNQPHAVVIGRGGWSDIGCALFYGSGNGQGSESFYFGGVACKHLNPAMPGGEQTDISANLLAGTVKTMIRGTSGRDAMASPTLTNIPGGIMQIIGGQGTGTASGGNVQLAITKPGGASNNTVNADFVAVDISGSDGSVAIMAGISFQNTTLLGTPIAKRFETDGTDLYWTNSAGTRKKVTIS